MHALKSPVHYQSSRPKRVHPKHTLRQPQQRHRALAYEITLKLAVNVLVSAAAIIALARLLPYNQAQESKLQELNATVKSTSDRVQRVRTEFSYYFDPHQARTIMQEQSDRIDPQRRPIVWTSPKPTAPAKVKAKAP